MEQLLLSVPFRWAGHWIRQEGRKQAWAVGTRRGQWTVDTLFHSHSTSHDPSTQPLSLPNPFEPTSAATPATPPNPLHQHGGGYDEPRLLLQPGVLALTPPCSIRTGMTTSPAGPRLAARPPRASCRCHDGRPQRHGDNLETTHAYMRTVRIRHSNRHKAAPGGTQEKKKRKKTNRRRHPSNGLARINGAKRDNQSHPRNQPRPRLSGP
ncbi:hypothetical protein CMUS01_08209 [Colletotrichum musicola]|uniref:Uncharacterized protein n=1 Tax=Colletotrichum musicola TaxID=2175873 RepID=A0A8H6NE90_9PEZI|nr:hypothetical protein CMUS01_08209 [Colletotrichum musicola]